VVEWTVHLEQTTDGNPPLISELLGLDCRWQAAEGNAFALRRRFPRMRIDSCASGGRRNDPETLRRSVALHPTDYRDDDLPVKQAIRHSLFQWIPYFGGPILPLDKVDAYAFRSTMGLSTVVCFDLRRSKIDLELLRELMTEWHEVADCFYADSPIEVAAFPLRGLDPDATYVLHDYDVGEDRRYAGSELLAGWRVEIPTKRTALLIHYRADSKGRNTK
jgi:alpha-galactosidase